MPIEKPRRARIDTRCCYSVHWHSGDGHHVYLTLVEAIHALRSRPDREATLTIIDYEERTFDILPMPLVDL